MKDLRLYYRGDHERIQPATYVEVARCHRERQMFAFMARALRESLRESQEPQMFGYDPFVFTEQTSLDIAEGRCDAPDQDGTY